MEASDWAIIIGAGSLAVTGILGAIFTGLMSLRQIPQVHKLVNSANTELKTEVATLRATIETLQDNALTKAESREAPVIPEARL